MHTARAVLVVTLLATVLMPRWAAAASLLVVDVASGKPLQAVNADQRRYPASLTKMMTLYLLFDALDRRRFGLHSRLHVSRRAAAQPPTKLGLLPGRTILVRDAILALATQSANDVAVVVAEAVAGSEPAFAARMTTTARRLGMRQTTFHNASGLQDRRQMTTARDMAQLGRALIRDFPNHYRIFATRSFSYASMRYENHNHLLGVYPGMDGIKTGYTQDAGFNLVASAVHAKRRILGVVMGCPSSAERNWRMVALLNDGFRKGVDVAQRPTLAAERKAARRTVERRNVGQTYVAQQFAPTKQARKPGSVSRRAPASDFQTVRTNVRKLVDSR
jgi:D-alanyl-D-alanine carboxypeptidase